MQKRRPEYPTTATANFGVLLLQWSPVPNQEFAHQARGLAGRWIVFRQTNPTCWRASLGDRILKARPPAQPGPATHDSLHSAKLAAEAADARIAQRYARKQLKDQQGQNGERLTDETNQSNY